ncbi:hypothetical protein NP493_798g00021 [Ridgeia piscesae]|uniref:Uncharacterized protein n=1 Tax=Ridgeia piscesae TaxID=27915 RepID=A0AAD9KNE6_RIDPI|nr:hypothetical protein NP493_798g00021 [Ridgeia piscesae]
MRIGDGFMYNSKVTSSRRQSVPHRSCVLCKAAGRAFNSHDLIDCRYLPQSTKKALGWSRLVTNDVCEEDEGDLYDGDTPENVFSGPALSVRPSKKQIVISGADIVYYGTVECKAGVLSVRSCSEHICHARQIASVSPAEAPDVCSTRTRLCSESNTSYSTEVSIDPDTCLTTMMSDRFRELHSDFDDVFNTKPSLYNGASGMTQAFVNMGPALSPQRKERLPQYDRSTLNEL